MQPKQKARVKAKINKNTQSGDIKILATILNTGYSTAYSKFFRSEKKTVLIMQEIIKNREKLIKNLTKKYQDDRQIYSL